MMQLLRAFFADLVVDGIEGQGMALIGGEEFAVVLCWKAWFCRLKSTCSG